MNIAVVTPWFPSNDGSGTGQFVLKEASALLETGNDIRIVHLDAQMTAGEIHKSIIMGLPVIRIGLHVRNPLHFLLYRKEFSKALEFADIIHSHAISALVPVSLVVGIRPWIHSEHWSALTTPESLSPWARPAVPVLGLLERLPDIVVGESQRLVSALEEARNATDVALVPCIVPAPNIVQPLPERDGVIRLVSTGGLIERKDPILAIHTLACMRDLGYRATLRWIGEGPLRDQCLQLSEELAVDAEFLGFQPYSVVQNELANADIFFAPTRGENFFVAAAEALVNGRPICVGANGGHIEYAPSPYSEIVSDQVPHAYAQSIVKLYRKTLNVDAADISSSVAANFSSETVACALLNLYTNLVTEKP